MTPAPWRIATPMGAGAIQPICEAVLQEQITAGSTFCVAATICFEPEADLFPRVVNRGRVEVEFVAM